MTTNGIITNLDGEFTLNAPANATLVISYIGYEPINVTLHGRTSLKIQMKEEALALETVVVMEEEQTRHSRSDYPDVFFCGFMPLMRCV